jgi:hypothetical protein
VKHFQQSVFLSAHPRTSPRGVVLETMEMQNPMDEQAIDRHIDRHPVFSGLAQRFANRDYDVADMIVFLGGIEIVRPLAGKPLGRKWHGGKRENVSRLVDVSKLPVQLAHRAVTHDGDVDVMGDGRITGRPEFIQDRRRPPA